LNIEIPEAFEGLFRPSRYKAYYGGRGSAKSHSAATAALIRAGQKPLRVGCFREVQLSIKDSIKQLLDDKIGVMKMGGFYESLQNEIRGKNGSQFIFAGLGKMTTDQIKSMEGLDIALVEEAQTISARSLEVLIPTIRKAGSELWFLWNPRSASDPVDARFRGEAVPEDAIIRRVNYNDNPFFPEELETERAFDERNNRQRYGHIWLGDYEPMAIGAIWDRLTIHNGRVAEQPEMRRILVGVDPAVSSESGSNEHGVVVAGLGADQRGYVLEDGSLTGTPHQWATRTIALFDKHEADAVVVEINQGGDMVKHTLESVRPGLPIIEVRATRGKHVRAEPVAAQYSLGMISHVGAFPKLEDQMCQMTAAGYEGEGSPDRVDAMVWCFTELFHSMTRRKTVSVAVPNLGQGGWLG
jgi:hypothetical protein